MNQFQDTPITDLVTGRTFLHRSYCASPKEAADFARLTFTNPAIFAVGQADDAAAAAFTYREGWNNLSCAPRDGKSLAKPASIPASGAVTDAPFIRIQTELF